MSVNITKSEGSRAERLRYCATTGRATCCVGPTGPQGPTGSFDYTATHDIDMSCNRILDVSSITFCDGTYMGPGASFDISTNQHLVLSSTGVSGITFITDNGRAIKHYGSDAGGFLRQVVYDKMTTPNNISAQFGIRDNAGGFPEESNILVGDDDRPQLFVRSVRDDVTQNQAWLNCAGGIATVGAVDAFNNTRIDVDDPNKIITLAAGSGVIMNATNNVVMNTPVVYVANTLGDAVINVTGEGTANATARFSNTDTGETAIVGWIPDQGGAILQSDRNILLTAPKVVTLDANGANSQLTLDGVGGTVNLVSGAGGRLSILGGGAQIVADAGIQLNAIAGAVTTTVANTMSALLDADGLTIKSDPTIGANPTLFFQNLNSRNTSKVQYDGTDMNVSGDITNLNLYPVFTKVKGNAGLIVGGGGSVDGIINVANRDETWAGSIAFNDGDKSLTVNNENAINLVSSAALTSGNTAQISAWADNGGVVLVADAPSVGHAELALITDGRIVATASNDININSTAGSANITVANGVTLYTQSSTASYGFDMQMRYGNGDTQLVNPSKDEQVPTNTIAVPKFQPRTNIPPVSITTVNPPPAPILTTTPFTWRYSGTGSGSSYCFTERVEVDIDITVLGALNDSIQWGVVMVEQPTANRYYSVGAYRSFDNGDKATGLEYTTYGIKTNPSGLYNHTANIRCYFDGVNNIIDGNSVVFEIFAISNAGVLTVDDGNISYRVRPTTRVA